MPLVKRLRNVERLLCGKAELAVGFLLQRSKVVEQRRFLADFLALHIGNYNRARGGNGIKGGSCCRKGFVLMFGECGERDAVLFRRDLDLVVGLRGKVPVLQITGTDHHQGRCLHPSE